jgi:hypothetical protein
MNFAVEAGVVSGLPTLHVDLDQLGHALIAELAEATGMGRSSAADALGLSPYSGLPSVGPSGGLGGEPSGTPADVDVQAP